MTPEKRKSLFWKGILFTLVFILTPNISRAQDITCTPSFFLDGEYNDNILFARKNTLDDFIFNFTPVLGVNYSTERMNINSLALVRFRRYLAEDDFDREDYNYEVKGRYQLTERLLSLVRFSYKKDFTFDSNVLEVEETDIIDQVEPGLESFYSEREQYMGFASLAHQFAELWSLRFGYRYLNRMYEFEENTDYEENEFRLNLNRRLVGQKDVLGPSLAYARNSSEVSEADSLKLGLIWRHLFSERTRFYSNVGVRYTVNTSKNTGDKAGNWRGFAHLRLRRRGETNVTEIGFRQSLQTASSGRQVNLSRIYLDSEQFLGHRLLAEFNGDFYIAREESDSLYEDDYTRFDVAASLRYLLTENHSVRLAYSYSYKYDPNFENDRYTRRNRVWFVFELNYPFKIKSYLF